jgi:hypothetical protein
MVLCSIPYKPDQFYFMLFTTTKGGLLLTSDQEQREKEKIEYNDKLVSDEIGKSDVKVWVFGSSGLCGRGTSMSRLSVTLYLDISSALQTISNISTNYLLTLALTLTLNLTLTLTLILTLTVTLACSCLSTGSL